MQNIRHLTFAKQDSQSSIIEIHKYDQFKDQKHEPHVQSSGSIILKEPSMVSLRNQSQLKMNNNADVNSRDFLEKLGGHGLHSSSKTIVPLENNTGRSHESLSAAKNYEKD